MPRKPASTLIDEHRTAVRRTQILEAAVRVFAEKGYHHATTKDIARTAELAEGTIYLYFASKAELLVALLEHFNHPPPPASNPNAGQDLSLRELLLQRLQDSLAQLGPRFEVMLAILPEVLADPTLRPQFNQRIVQPALTDLTGQLQARQERGEVTIRNIPMATRVFLATLLGLEILQIVGDEPVRQAWQNPAQLAEDLAQVLLDGLQPSKER